MLRLGKRARVSFVPDVVVVCIGTNGISRRQWAAAVWENFHIQRQHPEIGTLRASWTFAVAYAKGVGREILGKARLVSPFRRYRRPVA